MVVRHIAIFILCLGAFAFAQDMEPRSYSPAPIGTNFAVISYGGNRGSVVADPSLPITDASARFSTVTLGYYHSFALFGRQTSIAAGLPYVWGTANGLLDGVSVRTYRSGLADPRLRLAYFLIGSPALTPAEFKARRSRTVLGASLTISTPVGQYDPNLLINLGTNRWAFKPELGLSRSLSSWLVEADLGSWFFTENSSFFRGHVRQQAPMVSAQGHVSYTFRPRLWLSFDGTFYAGGRTTIDGIHNADRQRNARLGATLSFPLARSQSLKLTFSRGAVVRVGGNFTSISAAYQFGWLTRH